MVRGNWQKRVEVAEARRKEAKQRKQKTEDKRQYKSWVQGLFRLFDEYDIRCRHLDIWTDSIASDSPPLLDIISREESAKGGKRRVRTGSIETEWEEATSRDRSNSVTSKPLVKKKVHPRSKEANQEEIEEYVDLPLLCRSHFFTNCCNIKGGKRGGCRYVHYSSPYKTLYQVLSIRAMESDAFEHELSVLETALEASTPDEVKHTEPGSMEMVYHFVVDLEASEEQSSSDKIMDVLSAKKVGLASIVYIVADGHMVFDRYRDGTVLTPPEMVLALCSADSRARRHSIGSEGDKLSGELIAGLPGAILEHVLTFLPDPSVAAAAQVCRGWNHEIGQNSPNLWKHLLIRRGWPLPEQEEGDVFEPKHHEPFMFEFQKHYAVVRDVNAIKAGLEALASRKPVPEIEMSYQDFSSRKNAPSRPNYCSSVQVWSHNRVLVAYGQDCSLRLFGTVAKHGTDEKLCRELVYQRIDPYKKTKRRKCNLVSMGVDEETIGCLCRVTADCSNEPAYILVVLSRDEYLMGESSAGGENQDEPNLTVIDIGEAVLNFLLCVDVVDHRLLQLVDFLTDEGEVGDVEILVSQGLCACGYGRFVIEASISIPLADETGEVIMQLLDRKLFMFSASVGAIVWMGESNPLNFPLNDRKEHMILASMRHATPGGSRAACTFVVGSPITPTLMIGEVQPSGEVRNPQIVDASDLLYLEILDEGWTICTDYRRLISVSSVAVIVADTIIKLSEPGNQTGIIQRKCIVTFYPRENGESNHSSLVLQGSLQVTQMTIIRDQHCVLFCRLYEVKQNQSTREDMVAFHGPLLDGDAEQHVTVVHEYAIIVDIPSRCEIGRVRLMDDVLSCQRWPFEGPIVSTATGNTIGIGLTVEGVIMTGQDVRSMGERHLIILDDAKSAKKVKKKKRPSKGSKKDGFARGMSLRG